MAIAGGREDYTPTPPYREGIALERYRPEEHTAPDIGMSDSLQINRANQRPRIVNAGKALLSQGRRSEDLSLACSRHVMKGQRHAPARQNGLDTGGMSVVPTATTGGKSLTYSAARQIRRSTYRPGFRCSLVGSCSLNAGNSCSGAAAGLPSRAQATSEAF